MDFPLMFRLILRGWWRNKLFFAVAVISLSVGLACTNLLLTYFVHDYFIEQNNPDKDRIFALRQDNFFEEGQKTSPFSIMSLKPIQMPSMNMDEVFSTRRHFSTDWRTCHYFRMHLQIIRIIRRA